jgi:hypothetical protein
MSATTREPSYIAPDNLYSLRGGVACSGVSSTRIREAGRKYGLKLPWIVCGKRKFIRGSDLIRFIELLSEIEQRQGA